MIRVARSVLVITARGAVLGAALGAALGSALGVARPAAAMTKAGVTMPDTMQVDGTTLHLNGIGVRTFTLFNVRGYVGALYLPTRTGDAATALSEPGPKALVMQFARSASQGEVHDLYVQSSTLYCAHHGCTDGDRAAFAQLLGTVRAVRPGDRTGFIVGDAGVRVLFDDRPVATIAVPGFGRTILESDLGATPPSVQLRDGLLGHDD